MTAGNCALYIILVWMALGGICFAAVMFVEAWKVRERSGRLEFKLPEQEIEFKRAANAEGYASVIRTIDEQMRARVKYWDLSEETQDTITEFRGVLADLCGDHGIDPWEEDWA